MSKCHIGNHMSPLNCLFSVTPLLLPVYFVYENLFFVLKRKDWVVSKEDLTRVLMFYLISSADPEGGQGVRTPPLEDHK